MTTENERARFEAWASCNGYPTDYDSQSAEWSQWGYIDNSTQHAAVAWTARASSAAPSVAPVSAQAPAGWRELAWQVVDDPDEPPARRQLAQQLLTPPADAPTFPAGLHPRTADLVRRFSVAMAEKLFAAQEKYGYSDGWADPGWMDECRTHLLQHVAKGDPRDVGNYAAFLWHHGASTAGAPADARDAGHELLRQAIAAMTKLRAGLESPDCNGGTYVFAAAAVREFTDEQARLMYEENRLTAAKKYISDSDRLEFVMRIFPGHAARAAGITWNANTIDDYRAAIDSAMGAGGVE